MINVRVTLVDKSNEVDGSLTPARVEVSFVVVLKRIFSTSTGTATIVNTDHRRRCQAERPPKDGLRERATA